MSAPADMPTVTALYASKDLNQASTSPHAKPSAAVNDRVSTIQADLTELHVDAIVNAANESLLGGGGVDGAIHRAAGPGLLRECRPLDGCDTGSAKITGGHELPAKKVIHAVGPVYKSSKEDESTQLLASCYRTSLELAAQNECRSIAFSAISTGVYGFPSGPAAQTACKAVREFLDGPQGDKIERVIFCNFLDKDVNAYKAALPLWFPPVEGATEA